VRASGAILQGILQGSRSGGCYYKVLTGRFVPRSWAFGFGRFVAGHFVFRSSFLIFLFLASSFLKFLS